MATYCLLTAVRSVDKVLTGEFGEVELISSESVAWLLRLVQLYMHCGETVASGRKPVSQMRSTRERSKISTRLPSKNFHLQ